MIENSWIKSEQKMVICDNCGDGFMAEDFADAMEKMYADGWKRKKIGRVWCHYCADCGGES